MSSIFTKIVNGEIPCYKIAEDENYLAFLDVMPLAKGHTLVIPKKCVDLKSNKIICEKLPESGRFSLKEKKSAFITKLLKGHFSPLALFPIDFANIEESDADSIVRLLNKIIHNCGLISDGFESRELFMRIVREYTDYAGSLLIPVFNFKNGEVNDENNVSRPGIVIFIQPGLLHGMKNPDSITTGLKKSDEIKTLMDNNPSAQHVTLVYSQPDHRYLLGHQFELAEIARRQD